MHLPVTAHDVAVALLTDSDPGSFLVVLAELALEDDARDGAFAREVAARHNGSISHDRVAAFLDRLRTALATRTAG